ncbi:arylamine N-acetyltransferase family protein [Neobacillus terrae]|uniref:arylamine N-acetyltransferase family protein n=1 Tax=Neobacillus terrae TaxID=3034837 RepID=UPI00140DFD37|nr:arylamine N-acetyltransferase [Neobacillus terrae]NHM33025.1 arylamine N-acetyltransferase [Neobacillus terrae]
MTLTSLFLKRIGIPETEKITFHMLDELLEKTALTIPFENLCIINKNTSDINQENLTEKILIRNEGGVCYELNTLLYFVLKENGFQVDIVRGVVFDHKAQDFAAVGRTHVINLVCHDGYKYVVDTGFGGNLALKPIPLSGETVSSSNGEFRIRKEETHYGGHLLEMKLKHKDTNWKKGYAFDPGQPITDIKELNEVQSIINVHPLSSFNKGRLITRLTEQGSVTLTDTSLTELASGSTAKKEINPMQFSDYAREHFRMKL